MNKTTPRRLGRVSALAALALVLTYVLALGTDVGADLDARMLPTPPRAESGGHHHTPRENTLDAAADAALVLALLAVLIAVLLRRRRDHAAIATVSVLGACGSAYVLKPLLSRTDPLGGEAGRALDASFPSGHATAAMSFALVAFIVAPPWTRTRVAAVGVGFAASMGIGLVASSFHYPSDVLAGYLLAGAWVSATTALANSLRLRRIRARLT